MNRNVVVTIGSMIFGSLTSGSIKISTTIARKRKNAMTLARRRRRKRNTIVSLVKNTDTLAVIAKD
ncbi:hypothetical protein C7H81_00865 [Bacillus subtilis]|nr:hypothetical protein CVV77_07835 [Bacillus sp. SN1]PSI05568.1 hypothetical protein C7H81_00865 [Bacillus subtilis]